MNKISFIKSNDRIYNIERCLSLIKSEVMTGLKEAKRVVIKPNCATDTVALAATHAEAIRAVLEFITPLCSRQITLAEGSGVGDTLNAFKKFGYFKLQDEFGFAIVDLNNDDFETVELLNKHNEPWPAQVAKTVLESDFLISISPPKTHNSVVYSGAVKNTAVGSLLRPVTGLAAKLANNVGLARNNKALIHQSGKIIHKNIKRLSQQTPLKLAILDAYEAMQGEGPVQGEMVPAHFAIASSNPVAADWLACQLMGISINDVGYLTMLEAGQKEYFVVGDLWQENIIRFKMPSNFNQIRQWR